MKNWFLFVLPAFPVGEHNSLIHDFGIDLFLRFYQMIYSLFPHTVPCSSGGLFQPFKYLLRISQKMMFTNFQVFSVKCNHKLLNDKHVSFHRSKTKLETFLPVPYLCTSHFLYIHQKIVSKKFNPKYIKRHEISS